MENRVYYGEYSLKHWIELILKKNIVLPEYQRLFVWNEAKVKTLIEALKDKQFVPSVTIGALKNNGSTQNIILDGQQRLTSILLAHLGLFPDKDTYKNTIDGRRADENDSSEDDDEPLDDILDWKFDKLTEKGKTKEDVLQNITAGNYKTINLGITDNFLKNTFLGFSYLVPQVTDPQQQQKYYSTVFRSINFQGEKLSVQESRQSLYFLNSSFAKYFEPEFCKGLVIKSLSLKHRIDFVRYLSLLSQYKKTPNPQLIAQGYKSDMEKYYEEYIYSVVGTNNSQIFDDFSTNFPDSNYTPRLVLLETAINTLDIPKQYSSIIEADMYLLGLIYTVVFKGYEIDSTRKGSLLDEIKSKSEDFQGNASHKKSPAAMKHLT